MHWKFRYVIQYKYIKIIIVRLSYLEKFLRYKFPSQLFGYKQAIELILTSPCTVHGQPILYIPIFFW